MPYLIWSVIVSVIPWIISKLLRAIGFGVLIYTGMSLVLDQAESYIFDNFNNIGSDLFQILSIAGVDQGIAILFSCFAAALALKSAGTGGRVRKGVWKKPGPFEA